LIKSGRRDDAKLTWDWMTARGFARDTLAGEYVEFLIRQGQPESAASVWRRYIGARADGYGEANYDFNGSVESNPIESPFDWNTANTAGVKVTRDGTTAQSGKSSLRIDFAGTENLDVAVASQFTFIRPGRYRLHAFIRTAGLTTDQGIRFRISDAESVSRLDESFGNYIGTNPWSEVEDDVRVPSGTRLLQVQVIRRSSMKFDN